MRPKTVILVLGVTIALVGLAAIVKGLISRDAPKAGNAEVSPTENAAPNITNAQINPTSTNSAAFLEQLRAADLAKELDQVRDLLADGSVNAHAAGLLLGKVTHKEPEVRKAALEALVQLNDTNVIAGLEQVQSLTEDPREKVAIMDAVSYLKLPPANMPEGAQHVDDVNGSPDKLATPKQVDPTRQPVPRKQGRRKGGGVSSANADALSPAPNQTQPIPASQEGNAPQ